MTQKLKFTFVLVLFILAGFAIGVFWFNSFSSPEVSANQSAPLTKQQPLLIVPTKTEEKIAKNSDVPILMYHHVGFTPEHPDSTRVDLTVSPTDFESQVRYLKAEGYESASLSDLIQNKNLSPKTVVFTFDDGYSDVFENALPILSKYGYSGSVAVITNYVGTTNGTNVYASWEQIKKAHDLGFEIVSHSQTHFDVLNSKFSEADIIRELRDSRADLEKQGIATDVFIYPYGHLTDKEVEVVKAAGYKLGLTTAYGLWNKDKDQLRVPRVRVHGHQNFEKFKLAIVGQLKK